MGDAIDGGFVSKRFGYKPKPKYTRCFAWLPKRCIKGNWHWFKPMYCESTTLSWTTSEYGGYGQKLVYLTPRQYMFYKLAT